MTAPVPGPQTDERPAPPPNPGSAPSTASTGPVPDRAPAAGGEFYRGVCALAIIAKAPRPGASKTRLSPPLLPGEAADLSRCFIRDTTGSFARVREAGAPAQGVAVFTPDEARAEFAALVPAGFPLVPQRPGNFGERLRAAVDDVLAHGFSAVCLVDSDSPTVPEAALRHAAERLTAPGERIVLGPSDDGGYYLLGLQRQHLRLFADISWSTAAVLAQTLARAAELGLAVELLPPWYDVDDGPTLARLCGELFGGTGAAGGAAARHTRQFLRDLLDREGRSRIWPA